MNPRETKPPSAWTADFLEKIWVLCLVVTGFAFTYLFFEVVILTFGAVLIATTLSLLAAPLHKWLGLQRWAAVLLATLALIGAIGLAGYLFGTRLTADLENVFSRMSEAQAHIRAMTENSPLGKAVVSRLGNVSIPVAQIVTSIFGMSTSVIAGVVVAAVAGMYFAAQPSLYLDGFLMLFPEEKRLHAAETAEAVANGLYRWLEGQFISMVLVGVIWATAAWLIGLPSPLALGLIAGITEFIPYVGPVLAAIPALLVAATQGLPSVLWTFGAYIAIHAFEGNIVAPIVAQRLVNVPPALMLLGIAALSIIFGTVAILFAAPIVVVLFVLIKKLYVRETLGEPTTLPGEEKANDVRRGAQ